MAPHSSAAAAGFCYPHKPLHCFGQQVYCSSLFFLPWLGMLSCASLTGLDRVKFFLFSFFFFVSTLFSYAILMWIASNSLKINPVIYGCLHVLVCVCVWLCIQCVWMHLDVYAHVMCAHTMHKYRLVNIYIWNLTRIKYMYVCIYLLYMCVCIYLCMYV